MVGGGPVNSARPRLPPVLLEHELRRLARVVRELENQRAARALPALWRLPRVRVDVLLGVVAQALVAGTRRLIGVRGTARAAVVSDRRRVPLGEDRQALVAAELELDLHG